MQKFYISFILSFIFCITSMFGQLAGGIYFNYNKPLKEYDQNLHNDPMGFSFNVLYTPKNIKNLSIGGELGVAMYANDTYDVMLDDLGVASFKVEEEDCFFSYQIVARYQLTAEHFITPYVEGIIGGTSFFSTQITEEEFESYYESNTSFHGTALKTGFGGGLLVKILDNLRIDINAVANKGTHATYRSIGPEDAQLREDLSFGQQASFTNSVNLKLGIFLGF